MLDKKGTFLEKEQNVIVGKPKDGDKHQHEFSGIIIDVLENRGTVIVEDMCRNAFEVDADNVTVED